MKILFKLVTKSSWRKL